MTRSWIGLLLAGALVVGACGSGDDSDSGSSASASGEGAAEEGAFPVSIEHKYGTTTIEQAPERIVTVGLIEQDVLLALGVVPVGTTEWFGDHPGAVFPWAQDELEELGGETPEVVGESADGATNFEAVARQRPDLILALHSDIGEEDYDRLSEIAPTVAQPEGYIDFGVPWDELTRTVGQAVGRPDEADAVVEDVEAQFETVREEHSDLVGATTVMATPYEGIFVYGPEDPRGRFLSALGLELPPDLAEITGEEFGAELSQERADMLDVDVIIWLDPDDGEGPLGGPLYETFAVHTEGREVFLDSFEDPLGAATSFITPLSLPFLLEGLVPMLEAAVDGDPATEVPASAPS
jgi:iron complex transport system substrate-binding protein